MRCRDPVDTSNTTTAIAARNGNHSIEEILADYPYLEAEDIVAVLEFAANQNDHPVLRSA